MLNRRELGMLGAGLVMSGLAPRLATAKDSGFKIMMTPKWTGFPYFELTGDGAKAAAKELGDTLIYAGADHADVSLQVETLQNFVNQKPDAIILAAIDLNAVAPVLEDARKRGIVVTTYDADAAVPARDMFVNQLSYEQAAKVMLDAALIDAPNGGEIAFMAASPTSPNHMAHIKIMTELTKTDPKYQVFKVGRHAVCWGRRREELRRGGEPDAGASEPEGDHLLVGGQRSCGGARDRGERARRQGVTPQASRCRAQLSATSKTALRRRLHSGIRLNSAMSPPMKRT